MQEEILRKIIKDSVHETLTGLGFQIHDPYAIQQDLSYLHKMRLGSEKVRDTIKSSIIGVVIPTFLYFLYEALLHFFQKIR